MCARTQNFSKPCAVTETAAHARLSGQGLRFLLAGGFNTAATYALFWLLCVLMHPQLAYAIAFAVGIGLAYALNALWVFGARAHWKSAALYPLLYLLIYLLNAGLLALTTEGFGWSPRLGLAAALCVSAPIGFLLNRQLLARRSPRAPVQAHD